MPAIVTANAVSGIKEINLPEYAEHFAAAGFVTVIFDYRYWGESSGEPRYNVAPIEFCTDISAALTFLAKQPEVDPNRIGGWGISMGGVHMLFLATWEPRFRGHRGYVDRHQQSNPGSATLPQKRQRPNTINRLWQRKPNERDVPKLA